MGVIKGRPWKKMNIAITIWGFRVSPLFDASGKLLIVDPDQGGVRMERQFEVSHLSLMEKCHLLQQQAVNVLICGAISHTCFNRVTAAGIEVIPLICGDIKKVLAAYLNHSLENASFFLPQRQAFFNHQTSVMLMDQGENQGRMSTIATQKRMPQ